MPVRRVAISLAGALGLVAAVSAQPPAPAAPPPPDFARDVVPILEGNCLRCHNSAKVEGGLLLESHEDLMRGGDRARRWCRAGPTRAH